MAALTRRSLCANSVVLSFLRNDMRHSSLLIAIILHLTISCGSQDGSPNDLTETYDGQWSGHTNKSDPILFRIKDNNVTFMSFSLYLAPDCRADFESNYPFGAVLQDSLTYGFNAPFYLRVSGQFDDVTNISGTIAYYSSPQACSDSVLLTWTAIRN